MLSRRFIARTAALAWVLLCLSTYAVFAQEAEEFSLKLNLRDIEVISAALTNMPWKDVNQTIGKLQQQINKQRSDAQSARDAKLIEDYKKEPKQ